jgi:methyl-accepting chemotaxis protein
VFTALVAFLLVLVPSRVDQLSRGWAQQNATGLALVLASSVAAGLVFEDAADVKRALGALDAAPEAVYAIARRPDSTVVAGWHPERAPATALPANGSVATQFADGMLRVVAPVRGKSGVSGFLEAGFSLAGLRREQRKNLAALLAVSLMLLAIGAGASFAIGTYLSRPLLWLARVAGSVAKAIESGDLAAAEEALGGHEAVRARSRARGGAASSNEIEALTTAFASLLQSLRDTSARLQGGAAKLSESVEMLAAAAKEQSQSIGAHAAALQQTQVTAQEIRQTSVVAAERANQVLQVAERAGRIGSSGSAAIEQSLRALQEIQAHVQQIAGKMSELNEGTRQIGDITTTVKDLADQSNMLALNAAIEAVRSGEHGRGFAVVAREIRSLADQSIKATGRVREALESVGAAIRGAAQMSESGTVRMESELAQVRSTGQSLREISGIVASSSSAVREIASTVSQQAAGISQIFSAVNDFSRMMEATVRQIEATDQSIKSVKDVSAQVLDVANRFRL